MKAAVLKPDRVFRALSDVTRLRILNLLLSGELCVCDLVDVLDVPQPTASRHLAYLRKVGLVTSRRESVWSYYQLATATSEFDLAIRKCIESCTEYSRMAKDARLLEKKRSACCE